MRAAPKSEPDKLTTSPTSDVLAAIAVMADNKRKVSRDQLADEATPTPRNLTKREIERERAQVGRGGIKHVRGVFKNRSI
jgi:hypothetical protein